MTTAKESIRRLIDGNKRFATDINNQSQLSSAARRIAIAESQEPFAIILGCSDSRVPAEIVFDQGLGDLFVIRVAGNIVAPSHIGSIEYAVEMFGSPLVVVLGHTSCGAIEATVDELKAGGSDRSRYLASIVDRIRPSVEALLDAGIDNDRQLLIEKSVRANVRASVAQIKHGSKIIEEYIAEGRLTVVGAEYSLETGTVDFFYDNPEK